MSDVLDGIRRELQQRLEATRVAAQEHERVRAALEALEHAIKPLERATRRAAGETGRRGRSLAARARPARGQDGSSTSAADAEPRSSSARANASMRRTAARSPQADGQSESKPRPRARASAQPVRRRAARGANREAVLAVVRERPGVTTRELATASGVSGGTLYALLRRLAEQGELAKRELPGGQTGYALTADDPTTTAAAGREAGSQESLQAGAVEDPAASQQTGPPAADPPPADAPDAGK